MKILLLYPFLPHPNTCHGSGIRMYNYLKYFSKQHSITLICFINDTEKAFLPSVEQYCDKVYAINHKLPLLYKRILNSVIYKTPRTILNYYNLEVEKILRTITAKCKYDIIHFELIWMSYYVNKVCFNNTIIIFSDAEIASRALMTRIIKNNSIVSKVILFIDYLKTKRYEKLIWEKFYKILTITKQDKELVLNIHNDLDVSVFPNGIDTKYFQHDELQEKEETSLLFVANFWHEPNVDGIVYFLKEIYPSIKKEILNITLTIVGKNSEKLEDFVKHDDSVKITGYVEDVRSYYSKSQIFIVPIITGGGMRGKVLEAMSLGLPVISTSLGLEGIEGESGKEFIVADTPNKFIASIFELLKNDAKRKSIIENARWLVKKKYDWNSIYSKLEVLYNDLLRCQP